MSSSVRIAEGAVVCDGAMLTGDITIGSETIVFPGAKVECLEGAGPIVIGRGCVIEEGVSVVNMEPEGMSIGDGNLFEVGCTVCAQQVGVPLPGYVHGCASLFCLGWSRTPASRCCTFKLWIVVLS